MTFAATANAVLYTGATPAFVDSQASDSNVDVPLLIHAVDTLREDGADIACVLPVDLFGRCVDYSLLEPAMAERGIPVIEDAAESLGASHAGDAAGSFGRSAALSFNGNKIMTTSGGGMLLSHDDDIIARARYLSTQARQPHPWYEHTEMGFNYRMSNILAALGVGQLARLDEMIARRRAHREQYAAAFADLEGVRLLGRSDERSDAEDNCWLTCAVLDDGLGVTPEAVMATLDSHGIEARHLWKPMHLQPLYSGARMFDTGVSADLFEHGVTLPSGSELSSEAIERVIEAFRSAMGHSP